MPYFGTTSLKGWCAALYVIGVEKHARAYWVDGLDWDGNGRPMRRNEICIYGNIGAIPALQADGLTLPQLLEWWEKDVCAPNALPFDLALILRRAARIKQLLEEREELLNRIEAIERDIPVHWDLWARFAAISAAWDCSGKFRGSRSQGRRCEWRG